MNQTGIDRAYEHDSSAPQDFSGSGEESRVDSDRPVIVLGDLTTHRGVVITASMNTFSNERRVARIGDLVSCPISGHGINPIVTASSVCEIDGRRVARHGDRTACGSFLLSSELHSSTE